MVAVSLYNNNVNDTFKTREINDGQDATEFIPQKRRISQRDNNLFYSQSVSVSGSTSTSISMTYKQQIEIWAKEFQHRKHILTQDEIEVINSDLYLELLEIQNSLP